MATSRRRDRGLLAVAVFKFVKAALLIVIGLAAMRLVGPEWQTRVSHWLAHLSATAPREHLQRWVGQLLHLGPRKLEALGIGAWVYAALFVVEGTGLLLQRRWAEYVTVISTLTGVPFEIYELAHDVTAARIIALVVNLAVVAYLIVRLRRPGRRDATGWAHAAWDWGAWRRRYLTNS